MTQPDPDALFASAMAMQPYFREQGPDSEARAEGAYRLFTQAAEAGHTLAMARLVARRDVGLHWAIQLAKRGDGSRLVTELTNNDWSPEARGEVLTLARAGEPWAQAVVGHIYGMGMSRGDVLVATTENGFGWLPAAKQPDVEARRWLELAASAGWADALLTLSRLETKDDPVGALALAQRAAEGVLTREQREYLPTRICELLERAKAPLAVQLPARQVCIDQGHAESMAWLADRYRLGEGVTQDTARAIELYQASADKGCVHGCRELGRAYEEGLGVAADDTRARELYERAAELGADAFSRDRLAEKYGLTWYARSAREKAKDKKVKAPAKARRKPAKAAKPAKPER